MKLRTILMILTICTLISVAVGGFSYYRSVEHSVLTESEMQTVLLAEQAQRQFADFLANNKRAIKRLAEHPDLPLAITAPSALTLQAANAFLDRFNQSHHTDVCFVLDAQGLVLASSNRAAKDSFVGKNYAFRPYFKHAIKGYADIYMALGVTSGRRGVYYSHPVYAPPLCKPVGVAVIKSSPDALEAMWQSSPDRQDNITLVTNHLGLVFIASDPQWLFRLLWEIPEEQVAEMAADRQFGTGPWPWSGLSRIGDYRVQDRHGVQYLIHSIDLQSYPGWRIAQLSDFEAVHQRLFGSLVKKAGMIIGGICLLIGGLLFYLYLIANDELIRRQAAEKRLKHEHGILDSIISASPVGICMLENRTIKWTNQAMRDMFRFSHVEDYEGRSTRMIYASESEYARVGKQLYALAAEGRLAETDALLRRTDGSVFTGLLTISANDITRPEKQAILIISDIDARVQSERERLKMEKLQSVLETAGAVCHELNQPLMALNGLCAMGIKETPADHPAYHRFEKILDEINRMGNITHKLSTITQYRTRGYTRETKIIDIDKSSKSPKDDDAYTE